ncbi:MAG: hypothetical protein H0U79_02565 [Solirubrobacterales bacterium]|nr:hypothetical protein [Solirubrobacterales bacterium]
MSRRLLALGVVLALALGAVTACGGDDVDADRPRSTPELTLPEGNANPDGGQGTATAGTESTPTESTPTESTPTESTPTEPTTSAPAAGQQGATAASELAGFCDENPGAC